MNTTLRLIIIGLLTFSSAGQSWRASSPFYSGAPPHAEDDAYETAEDTQLVVPVSGSPYSGVLNNDTDSEGNLLTAQIGTGPLHGDLVLNENGSFTYTPDENWNGTDWFTYRAYDGNSLSNPAMVTLTVAPVDDLPIALADSYTTPEDTSLHVPADEGVLDNDSQVDADEIFIAVQDTSTANGNLIFNIDGSFDYSPNLNFNGDDTFTYHASDGVNSSSTVTVTIHVTAVNDPPIAVADTYSTNEDTPLIVTAGEGVLSNDSDAEGDPMTAVKNSLPVHGVLEFHPDGSFTYTPHENWHGTDQFTYHAVTASASSEIVSVTLNVESVNDAPLALDDNYNGTEDTVLAVSAPGVLTNDGDIEGGTLTAVLVSQPSHGSVVLRYDGSFTYTPQANFNGPVTFTYRAHDGTDPSILPATVTLNLAAVNDPPVPVDDAFTTAEDVPYTATGLGVIANDLDVDDPLGSLTAVLVTGPEHGELTFNSNGTFHYVPDKDYYGSDSFTYYLNDPSGPSLGEATVHLTITSVNDVPVGVADNYSTPEDTLLTVSAQAGLLANDYDVDSTTLTVVYTAGPSHGTLTLYPNGSFTYSPVQNYNGEDSFTYRLSDGQDFSSPPTTVKIVIDPVNDAPVAGTSETYSTNEDLTLGVAKPGLLSNDSDVDGDTLKAVKSADPDHGTVVIYDDGSFTYVPAANYNGPDHFSYTVTDGFLSTAPIRVTITVIPVNDPPIAVFDEYNIGREGVLEVEAPGILENDIDIENERITIKSYTNPNKGEIVYLNREDGSFRYLTKPGDPGIVTFSYIPTDGISDGLATTVTINLKPQSSATLNWISPVADKHQHRIGVEEIPLNVKVTIPEGFPCTPKDIPECDIPGLTFEVTNVVVRYYRYDTTVSPPVAYEIDIVEGPDFHHDFNTEVLKENWSNEIDAAATIRIVMKNAAGEQVGEPIFVTTAKSNIWLRRLPWDQNYRHYLPTIIR